MNYLTIALACIFILTITYSYPLDISTSSKFNSLSSRKLDSICSYVSQLKRDDLSDSTNSEINSLRRKRFIPFPDMHRFLSTSYKIHHHHHPHLGLKSDTELTNKKHDFEAYLCSITKDSEEMTDFISIFIEVHGEPPAFNLFESCERIEKRDQLDHFDDKYKENSSIIRFDELSDFCSSRSQPEKRFTKRWRHTVGGPMSIDYINQMLESRKVKSYPYSVEVDPYLVGR